MKIALVHPKFDRSGGAERYACTLAEGLVGRGHEVHLFGRRAGPLAPGMSFRRVACLPLGRAVKTWTFSAAACRRLSRERFSVVQGLGKTWCQTVHRAGGGVHRAYRAREAAGSPSLYDRVVLGIEDRLFASPLLRGVVAPSHWVAEEIRRYYPSVEDRIRVIPNGVDTRSFHPDGRERDRVALGTRIGVEAGEPLLLLVATNFRLKGLEKAVGLLVRLGAGHLVVVGGDEPGPYRAIAARQGVGARLHFLGSTTEMAPLYRSADLLVHPTAYDPFANACLEALACGTPVLTSDRNGAGDVLVAGKAGTVLPLDDPPESWASAAEELLARQPEVRAEAREVALRCSLTRHVEAVDALYGECGPRSGEAA